MTTGVVVINPHTYYLIRQTTTFPNASCPPRVQVDWYQKVRVSYEGTSREGWTHWRGGGYATFSEVEILVVMDVTNEFELDFTCTTPYVNLKADAEVRRTESSLSGWLSPEADWFPCQYHSHDLAAEYIFKRMAPSLTASGWLKLTHEGFHLGHPTDAQAGWLLEHRHF